MDDECHEESVDSIKIDLMIVAISAHASTALVAHESISQGRLGTAILKEVLEQEASSLDIQYSGLKTNSKSQSEMKMMRRYMEKRQIRVRSEQLRHGKVAQAGGFAKLSHDPPKAHQRH